MIYCCNAQLQGHFSFMTQCCQDILKNSIYTLFILKLLCHVLTQEENKSPTVAEMATQGKLVIPSAFETCQTSWYCGQETVTYSTQHHDDLEGTPKVSYIHLNYC
jgi:hypothetical protein